MTREQVLEIISIHSDYGKNHNLDRIDLETLILIAKNLGINIRNTQ